MFRFRGEFVFFNDTFSFQKTLLTVPYQGFKRVFHYGAGIVMDTFWESGQEGEEAMVQVCCFIPFVWYPP